jgi:hypothetical protein
MDNLGNGGAYDGWATDPAGEPTGPLLTFDGIREMVQVGIDQLDCGEYVTGEQLRRSFAYQNSKT